MTGGGWGSMAEPSLPPGFTHSFYKMDRIPAVG